ncbi:MAG: hypothetical protein V4493_01710 [Pseudomonadota bacterium]
MQELLYVEMDCPKCPLSYGVSPCTASGDNQCKNTPATCQDLEHYEQGEIQTVRWVKAASYVPIDTYAVPNLHSVSTSSQRINPGENLGKRERVSCAFFNHQHNDIDLDPYVGERIYNPFERGTYWGKFAAMYPNVQGYPVRIIRGNTDQNYADMETSYYVADVGKIAGDKTGYSLTAKDVLDFAEGNKTLCPTPSNGLLASPVTFSTTTVDLTPVGIGAEYPASFDASIGDECVQCTISGDTVTFVERGAYFTVGQEHDEGDTLQIMESFVTQNASQILERLLGYTETPGDYYNVAQWDAQVALVSSPSLTCRIAEPTPVFELIQDLMKDLALDIHTDVVNKKIIMQFLIVQYPTMAITDENMDSPQVNFYDDKRVDLFFLSFGRRNPLLKMDEPRNYPATIVRASSNPVSLIMGNPAAIRRQRSRWIPALLRTQASQTTEFVVGRYELAPRGLTCKMKASLAPQMAQVVNVVSSVFEDAYGGTPTIPMQVVSLSKAQGNYTVELEEFRATGFDPGSLTIVVSLVETVLDMGEFSSLRAIFDSIYPGAIPVGSTIRFEADPGVIYGGDNSSPYGFSVIAGDWPEIADITLQIVNLIIVGFGGGSGSPGSVGFDGGNAFYTRVAIELIDCVVGGGGGGGGSSNFDFGGNETIGGGGAGYNPGSGYNDGSLYVGGDGQVFGTATPGGKGGDLGEDGDASDGPGGIAGVAIDGDSYITISGTTTIYGSQIN